MSDPIQVGDRVQWQRHGHRDGTFVSGVVTSIGEQHPGITIVYARSDLGGGQISQYLDKVTRVPDDNAIVAAVLERAQDDATREQVIHDLRAAADPDGWSAALANAGSLGDISQLVREAFS